MLSATLTVKPMFPLLAVAEKLVDGFRDGIIHPGRLELDHHHRQAVQKQHDVGNDVVLGSKDANLELADGDEAVVVAILEINEMDRRVVLSGLPVPADAGVLKQQIEDVAIVLQQPRARESWR